MKHFVDTLTSVFTLTVTSSSALLVVSHCDTALSRSTISLCGMSVSPTRPKPFCSCATQSFSCVFVTRSTVIVVCKLISPLLAVMYKELIFLKLCFTTGESVSVIELFNSLKYDDGTVSLIHNESY